MTSSMSANDPTAMDRWRRWKDRTDRGRKPSNAKQPCVACGKLHLGARGAHCSRCWEKFTPEGRAFKAERVRATRQRQRAAAAG